MSVIFIKRLDQKCVCNIVSEFIGPNCFEKYSLIKTRENDKNLGWLNCCPNKRVFLKVVNR